MVTEFRRGGAVPLALLAAIAGCIKWHAYELSAPASDRQAAPTEPRGLRAGFGRADITPPPGVGLGGYGPEARVAAGYRLRLYARALVLEDASGELVALVVADLPLISPSLHRRTAALVWDSTKQRIGADRLIISATHTHAGPAHYFAERQYNQSVSSLDGYDPALVDFLVSRLGAAVIDAYRGRSLARVAWAMAPVWGHTRNRSYDAFLRNKPEWTPPFPRPPGLDPAQRAVDPTWTLLRVDLRGSGADDAYYPAGAFSIFAMHGTGNPAANDLLDADVHGPVERGLERHIDSLDDALHGRRPRPPQFATRAVHLFANGTEGDVSPDWPANARCRLPTLRPATSAGGPRTPPAPWAWDPPPPASVARCVTAARTYVNALGDTLTRRAAALFDALRPRLTGSLDIAVAFHTVPLGGDSPAELCPTAEIGPSTMVGAEDGPTRLSGWRLFGIFPIGLEEGGSAVRPNPRVCQREKRVVLDGPFRLLKRWFLVGEHGFPETTQVAVVRLGGLLLGAVPAEVTTAAGAAMKRAIGDSARARGLQVDGVAIVGLANAYVSYVTSAAEYSAQHYEGGSTLFGPGSAAFFATQLGRLAAALAREDGNSPPSVVTPLKAYPGSARRIVKLPRGTLPDPRSRKFIRSVCRRDTLVSRWVDGNATWQPPASGQKLVIERKEADGWASVVWDDHRDVEVRLVKARGDRNAEWEVRWARSDTARSYRVVLLARDPFPALADSLSCP